MSPEQQEMIDRGAERIAGMNLGISKEGIAEAKANAKDLFAQKPKKRRSDAGKPRVKPAEAAPGAITREQAQRLADLIASKESRRVEWDACLDAAQMREQKFTAACVELDDFIASITAK